MMGVPATGIEAAVAARSLSAMKAQREKGQAAYGAAVSQIEGGADLNHALELALFAGKIAAYAQGFAVMQAASDEFGWDLPMGVIAKIWREGCIIRSQFLGEITAAFGKEAGLGNLLLAPDFIAMMGEAHPGLRRIVALAAEAGLPVPALSAALAYFDGFRQARGTANLVQAQRDFFGAHSFERTDAPGAHHGPWGNGG
jgi:6-phosphogluconate dehydrogenase